MKKLGFAIVCLCAVCWHCDSRNKKIAGTKIVGTVEFCVSGGTTFFGFNTGEITLFTVITEKRERVRAGIGGNQTESFPMDAKIELYLADECIVRSNENVLGKDGFWSIRNVCWRKVEKYKILD